MDDLKHFESFAKRLFSKERWNSIIADIRELRAEIQKEHSYALDDKCFSEAPLVDRIGFDLIYVFNYLNLKALLEAHLFEDFVFPPITSWELSEIAQVQLAGLVTDDEFSIAIERVFAFVKHLAHVDVDDVNIGEEISFPDYCQISTNPSNGQNPYDFEWSSPFGFQLRVSSPETFKSTSFYAWAKVSPESMKEIDQVLKRVIPSLGLTLCLLNSDPNEPSRFSKIPFEYSTEKIGDDLAAGENSLFGKMLTYYFLTPTKSTSTFEQRMRNAIHLLVEADEQSNRVIGLSLCLSAIEAMVCEKTEGIIDELSRNVASLLEPNSLKRVDAIKAVKNLYNVRSKVLHGDAFLGTELDYWASRCLATATLVAATEWKRHARRAGGNAERQDFLSELKTISITGGQMVGVDAILSRFLPAQK